MTEQVAIPVEEAQPTSGRCAWCGATAFRQIELEKARYTKAANGVRVIARRPIMAWACVSHELSLQRRGDE